MPLSLTSRLGQSSSSSPLLIPSPQNLSTLFPIPYSLFPVPCLFIPIRWHSLPTEPDRNYHRGQCRYDQSADARCLPPSLQKCNRLFPLAAGNHLDSLQ